MAREDHQSVYGIAREDGRKRPDVLAGLYVNALMLLDPTYAAPIAGLLRSTRTWPSFTSVRKVLRSVKQGACTALPLGTWKAPKCRLHSITSPSRMPSARFAKLWVQHASVA